MEFQKEAEPSLWATDVAEILQWEAKLEMQNLGIRDELCWEVPSGNVGLFFQECQYPGIHPAASLFAQPRLCLLPSLWSGKCLEKPLIPVPGVGIPLDLLLPHSWRLQGPVPSHLSH